MDTLAPSALRYDAGLSLVDTLVATRLRCDEGKEQLVDTLVAARLRCDVR
ncbi:hypothetical protein [Fibrobacter sp.]|nr:hypothetical protein [Fibrobacter sp.]MBR4006560.1 hypothetical protein [Fibrobacter sp.]